MDKQTQLILARISDLEQRVTALEQANTAKVQPKPFSELEKAAVERPQVETKATKPPAASKPKHK